LVRSSEICTIGRVMVIVVSWLGMGDFLGVHSQTGSLWLLVFCLPYLSIVFGHLLNHLLDFLATFGGLKQLGFVA
jgi:hypothetical protein